MNVSFREQAIYAFGPFRLDAVRHVLLRDGVVVRLAPRLFDTLLYLVQHAGRVVERDELLRAVWGGRIVDESNLKQTIFALRKALQADGADERLIVTAPTRGYLFAASVRLEPDTARQVADDVIKGAATPAGRAPRPAAAWVVAVLAMTVAGAFAVSRLARQPLAEPFAPPPHTVAVLAFSNAGGDPAQSYFSDGIAEELIGALSRNEALHVAARTSSFAFKGRPDSIAAIGRQLNVGAVLEGSVRRDGAHVRILADLIDTTTGFALWSRSFDREGGTALQMQADIAAAVAASLSAPLLAGEAAKSILGGTANDAAFDAYLRGVALAEASPDPGASKAALPAFNQAVALDPGFALARARRAHAMLVIGNTDAVADVAATRRMVAEAEAEAQRAIALAPGLGIAHQTRGAALMSLQNFPAADKEIALAHALAPGDAGVTMDYALSQLQFGRTAAGVEAARNAATLDPLSANSYVALASALLSAGRFTEAEAALHRARILGGRKGADAVERAVALARGDFQAVLPACEAGSAWPDMLCLARAYHGLGRQADAQAQLARMTALLGDNGAYQYAEIYAQWGQPREAVRWLQTAYRLHDAGMVLMKSDALLAPLRETAEYRDIERALHFPA